MAVRLGKEAHDRRVKAGLRLFDIAEAAGPGISRTSVHEFEQGDGWRRETDRIVAAYAELLDLSSEELWHAAIDRSE